MIEEQVLFFWNSLQTTWRTAADHSLINTRLTEETGNGWSYEINHFQSERDFTTGN
jgi:hypothetical protein